MPALAAIVTGQPFSAAGRTMPSTGNRSSVKSAKARAAASASGPRECSVSPGGTLTAPEIATRFGHGITETGAGTLAGTGNRMAPFRSGALTPTASVGSVATRTVRPSASTTKAAFAPSLQWRSGYDKPRTATTQVA